MDTTWQKQTEQGTSARLRHDYLSKTAASSFAAVGATLRSRLLSLTIHEAIVCDQHLDVVVVTGQPCTQAWRGTELLYEDFPAAEGIMTRGQIDEVSEPAMIWIISPDRSLFVR